MILELLLPVNDHTTTAGSFMSEVGCDAAIKHAQSLGTSQGMTEKQTYIFILYCVLYLYIALYMQAMEVLN